MGPRTDTNAFNILIHLYGLRNWTKWLILVVTRCPEGARVIEPIWDNKVTRPVISNKWASPENAHSYENKTTQINLINVLGPATKESLCT